MFKSLINAPGLSWDTTLKMTKVKVEPIPDPDFIFLKKGTRDGVSCLSNRYSRTNNKYSKCYNPKQESKHIVT